jgi:hypothetical protein
VPVNLISAQAQSDQDWEELADWFAGQNMNALGYLADALDRVGRGERIKFDADSMRGICRMARVGLTEAYLRFERKADDCQE